MKQAFIPFIIFLLSSACSNSATETSANTDSSAIHSPAVTPAAGNEIQITADLPFGYKELINFSYPKRWEGDSENYGHLKQPDGKEFENIGEYFNEIHSRKTQKNKPEILELTHLKLGTDFPDIIYVDTLTQQKTDSLKYRLPDIGKYQCYYFFESSKKIYGDYGVLLLLDPNTKTGKTINIYYMVGGEQSVSYRYFYIDGTIIKIYEGAYYDDGCSLNACFQVTIEASGQVKIDDIRQR